MKMGKLQMGCVKAVKMTGVLMARPTVDGQEASHHAVHVARRLHGE